MSDDALDLLPYRAEYAKSGRSSCKGCKMGIAKDELRLAVMVQSPLFDGSVPNWHHFDCFFQKQRPKNPGDVAHLDSLRWADQEKIRNRIAMTPGSLLEAAASSSKKKSKRSASDAKLADYKVEYAKSSRAMCRGCELKCVKDELRISKKDFESENARSFGGMDRWHHVECFVKMRADLEFFESGADLPGFKSLKKEDQQEIKKVLPKIEPTGKDAADGPSMKKIKKEEPSIEPESKALKKQNQAMFKIRDSLKYLKNSELAQLLTSNDQEDVTGPERKLDRLADLMTFGSLKRCKTCKSGQLVYTTGVGYQCTGDLSAWTKCQNVESDPERAKFRVPEELCEKAKYKCKIGTRIMPAVKPTSQALAEAGTSEAHQPKIERFAPFRGMSFYVMGKTTETRANLKKKIEQWGGKLSTKLELDVSAIISTEGELEKMNEKMEDAKRCGIHVVPETYIEACASGNAVDKISEMAISSWGTDPKARVEKSMAKSGSAVSKSRFEIKSGSRVKLKVKGGSAVDPDSHLEDISHVYKSGNDIYSVVLGLSDVTKNKNSYYKIQLLASDTGSLYWVFRSWGRIGTTIGGNKTEKFHSLSNAIETFKLVYFDETGNHWDERLSFQKVPGKKYPIDIDYGQSDTIKMSSESSAKSNLEQPVQDLIRMLFDVDIMKKVMLEFELDIEKMPLGKLSQKQIQKAYSVLSELQHKDGDIKPTAVIDASNRFYTLIPHSFGTKKPPLLDSKEIIKSKLEMLESLMEMEVAYSLLKETKGEGDDTQHPLDVHYSKLNTEISALKKDSHEFSIIEQYVKNTHGATHSSYKLSIDEVFKISRNGESKRFKPFKRLHNRKLLWHGSRLTNFVGILSQGLRIAPPEAPASGYMFGKGIYFADMVSKSANYCMTSQTNPCGLLLLCEVALGNMYERLQAEYIEKLPPGKHSTKGIGASYPDPERTILTCEGVQIPLGPAITDEKKSSLLYNEYIVYDVAQVKAQYLVKVNFNYK